MKVTLSIDDETVEKARDLASRRGTSLDQMIQDYLERVASDLSSDATVKQLTELWATSGGSSGGRGWTREELYDRAGLR